MQSDTLDQERELKLRLIELEQISAKALLEISRKLDLILERLAAGELPVRQPPERRSDDWWFNGWRQS